MIRTAVLAAVLALPLASHAQTTKQGDIKAKPRPAPAAQPAPRPESDSDRFRRQLRIEEDARLELRPLAPKPGPKK